ncbi:hypothetical protein [Mesorhizobium sp. M7A.F.Ce.TU.012.03.2.1]|uniref:hypothetical protein n=1 Tax=Mesorhizobium sp. M7A.F.Ce.TU.012.03.2.1 TaxID=2493681 RepID=UPI000FDA0951|nr:hypothetical protein [Mesorhizobium sp. M7A.F.Ce.TU.012.03.2.1]AZV18151.1 hypothetical protein EJ079_03105 [Mesorhizobium sp. M7A.F.Ce.TU.012.03.2.1]
MTRQTQQFDLHAARDAEALQRLRVQCVLSPQELAHVHGERLERLSLAGVDEQSWSHLRRCRGSECPHKTCSAACVFGERKELNRLVRQSRRLVRGGEGHQYFVTIIDPHYFLRPGRLNRFSIGALIQSLRRRLREAPETWNSARIVGAVDMAYDRERDGREWWAPHIHLAIAVDAQAKEIRRVLKPRRAPPADMVGRAFRPVTVERVTNLANAIAYSLKPTVGTREAFLDGRGNTNRRPFDVPAAALLEHDRWMMTMRPRDRSFLSGMMVSRGGVVPRKRRR